jgi:spore coat protein H
MWTARLVVGLTFLVCVPIANADEPKRKPANDVFELNKVWPIHITISAKDFAAMEPTLQFPGFGAPGRPPAPQPPPKADKPTDVHKGGSFGIEFPWVHGDVQIGDQKFANVGLRYKGGGSYLTSMGKLRRNIKVDLDHYVEGQQFNGMKSLNLNAGAMDASRTHESLGFAAFRAAGIPTPRTAFAEVTLTVPGKFDKELVGTYTMIEQVDKTFLKDRFKKANGLLLKPEVRMGGRGPLAYQGDDWEPYKAALLPKREPTKAEADRIIGLIKLIDRGTDEQFRKEIGNYLDVDEFLRFVGMTALLCNLDSFFTGGHNVYIYLDPETNKLVFIPWDLDIAFGGFFLLGQADQQADLRLTHPYPGEHKLFDRMMAVPELRERYLKLVREMTSKAFNKEKLFADLEVIEQTTKDLLAREAKAASARREQAGFGIPGMPNAGPTDLRAWIDKRLASVTAQLDGKSEGIILRGFSFGQPQNQQAGRPKPGDVMPGPLQDALGLSPEQKKQFAELQKETDVKVEKLLTKEQLKRFQEMRNATPGGPGGPPPGGFGPPGGGRPPGG